MCMHILEISNLNYSETFDANSNVLQDFLCDFLLQIQSYYNTNQRTAANLALQETVSPS